MTHIKFAIIVISMLAVLASISGCNTIAVSGPKKYKVDLQNHLLAITDEVQKDGIVSDKRLSRFEAFMTKAEAEFGKKGSYVRAAEVLDELQKAASATDPSVAYGHYNAAKVVMNQCQDLLTTEVKD